MCFRRLRAFLLKTRRSDSFQYKLWETHCYKIALGWLSCLRYLARITRPPQRWFSLLCCARLWDQFASRLSWESSLLWVVLLSMCSTASLSCVFAFVFNGPPWLPLEHRLWDTKSRGHLVLVLVLPAFECQRSCGWWIGAGAPTPECTRLSAQMENNWRAVKN